MFDIGNRVLISNPESKHFRKTGIIKVSYMGGKGSNYHNAYLIELEGGVNVWIVEFYLVNV